MIGDDGGPQEAGSVGRRGQQKPKRGGWVKWLVFLALLGGAVYAGNRWHTQLAARLAPAPKAPANMRGNRSVPVVVATAKRGDLPIYLDQPGTVIPLNTVVIRARVDGQIMKVHFVEGQRVQAGDLLLEIDPRPFQVQLAQAQGQLLRDQAFLKNAKLDVARYKSAGKAASQQQLDTAESAVAQYEGTVRIDQGMVDNANLQLTYCRITAPNAGQIGFRLVDPGNMVHASDSNGLAVITQVEPITVVFAINEDSLPQITKARSANEDLPVDVFNRDRKVKLATGKLLAVDSQIDLVTLTVKYKAIFDNTDHALFPNQAVNVRLLVDTKKDTILVPAEAIQRSPEAMFVYVVGADQAVELRPVKIGPSEGGLTSVEGKLAEGEVVVTDGVDKLEPGMKVTLPGAGGQEGDAPSGEGRKGMRSGKPAAADSGDGTQTGKPGGGQGRRGSHPDKPANSEGGKGATPESGPEAAPGRDSH